MKGTGQSPFFFRLLKSIVLPPSEYLHDQREAGGEGSDVEQCDCLEVDRSVQYVQYGKRHDARAACEPRARGQGKKASNLFARKARAALKATTRVTNAVQRLVAVQIPLVFPQPG